MIWLVYAVITAVLYGFFDYFVKLMSGKIHDGLGAFLVNIFSALAVLVYVLIDRYVRGSEINITREGL